MFVDQIEPADVAILDAALSGESRDPDFECLDATPPAETGFGAARGDATGVLLGAALWATILIPVFRP